MVFTYMQVSIEESIALYAWYLHTCKLALRNLQHYMVFTYMQVSIEKSTTLYGIYIYMQVESVLSSE